MVKVRFHEGISGKTALVCVEKGEKEGKKEGENGKSMTR